jgi:hypothetical protein
MNLKSSTLWVTVFEILRLEIFLFTCCLRWSKTVGIFHPFSEFSGLICKRRGFFLLYRVQTGSEAHPASYPMGTGRCLFGG